MPSANELAQFFPSCLPLSGSQRTGLRVESVGGRFRLLLSPPPYTAAEYLAWSDQFTPEFDVMREALKRPYARMEGDYRQPFEVAIPNYLSVRIVTGTLAQRAQCHLLLNQPDKALQELTLIHDLCRLLEGKPTMRPMTMVAIMTEAEVTRLYASTVADGLRWHAWREPQLVTIQTQLNEINLPPLLAEAFRSERAGIIRMYENALSSRSSRYANASLARNLLSAGGFRLGIPRGWFYQNYVSSALRYQDLIDSLDLADQVILTDKVNLFSEEMERYCTRFRPYTCLASIAIPNFTTAIETLALDQTRANEAFVACALERYWIANGEYPETLDVLYPHFIEKPPNDVIGGQPLKYGPTGQRQFSLYSVGWNEIDDGGTNCLKSDSLTGIKEDDWAWPPSS